MVEAGVFLGGSLERWLVAAVDVRVVGVGPFSNVTEWVERLTVERGRGTHGHFSDTPERQRQGVGVGNAQHDFLTILTIS